MSDYRLSQSQSTINRSRRSVGEEVASPLTACSRCRKQKLRCSRDRPTCKRCKDVSAVCDYPPPPDRKALAAQRLENAKARARQESDSSGTPREQRRLPASSTAVTSKESGPSLSVDRHGMDGIKHSHASEGYQDRRKLGPDYYQDSDPPLQATLRGVVLPSPEVAVFLIEIYFSRMYNACLLFHKKTFLSDYAANRIPDFVALSIFAFASIFLRKSKDQARQDGDDNAMDFGVSMLVTGDSTNLGYEWARAASQRVLMHADVPRIEIVQACQTLGLYWFSQGEGERAHMHFLIAYKMARLLKLHTQRDTTDELDAFTNEIRRRCFWSCWVTSCISQDNANFRAEPWKEVVGLAFPSDEDSYALSLPVSSGAFDEEGNIICNEDSNINRQPSAMGELVKLSCVWWEIQHFVKRYSGGKSSDSSAMSTALLELDRRLGHVFENFHPAYRYLSVASFGSPKLDPYSLFHLNSIYHFSACALHSSIIPLFSNTPSGQQVPRKLLRISAEEAERHSAITLDMATAFLSTRPDISRLPSITGFAMFVASTIHFKSLVAQRKLQTYGVGKLKAALSILERLKDHWRHLNDLWSRLESLFSSAGLNINVVSTSQSRSRTSSDEQPTDFEQIVSQKGTPEGNGSAGAGLYTYVADQETDGTSPRRNSYAPSPDLEVLRNSSPYAPSPAANQVVTSEQDGLRQSTTTLPVAGERDFRTQQLNPNPAALGTSYKQIRMARPPQIPGPLVLGQGFSNNDSMRPGTWSMTARIPNNYMQLDTATEDLPLNDARVNHTASPIPEFGQETSGYTDSGGMAMELDMGGDSIWWDQPYPLDRQLQPTPVEDVMLPIF